MWRLRFALSVLLALLPSWLKVPLYRMLFGYRIGRGVRIGLSPLFGVGRCRIGDHARIGSFNLFYQVGDLEIGDHAQIGFLNLFRGGGRSGSAPMPASSGRTSSIRSSSGISSTRSTRSSTWRGGDDHVGPLARLQRRHRHRRPHDRRRAELVVLDP